ncbi:MAG: hypothetical protein PVSMB4_08190 [Ktedonobacterales bacterium]
MRELKRCKNHLSKPIQTRMDALTGSGRPRKYWSDLNIKLVAEGFDALSERIGQLKIEAARR